MDLPEIKGNHRKFRTLVSSYIGNHVHQNNFLFSTVCFLIFVRFYTRNDEYRKFNCDLWIVCSYKYLRFTFSLLIWANYFVFTFNALFLSSFRLIITLFCNIFVVACLHFIWYYFRKKNYKFFK